MIYLKDNDLIVREAQELRENTAMENANAYTLDILQGAYVRAQHLSGFIPDFSELWEQLVYDMGEWMGYTAFDSKESEEYLYDYCGELNEFDFFYNFIMFNKICCKYRDNILNNPQGSIF